MSDTLIREDTDTKQITTEDGDHERFAHYVFGKDAKSKVTEAMVLGTPVKALCGKQWVPSRDASKYPVCPDCLRIKNMLQGKKGE